jgi:hypothetical protein
VTRVFGLALPTVQIALLHQLAMLLEVLEELDPKRADGDERSEFNDMSLDAFDQPLTLSSRRHGD